MSRSRSYFRPSARARRGKRSVNGEGDVRDDSAVTQGGRITANPTPFSYEIPARAPDDWARWDGDTPATPEVAKFSGAAIGERVLDVRTPSHAPKPAAVPLPSQPPPKRSSLVPTRERIAAADPIIEIIAEEELPADSFESVVASTRAESLRTLDQARSSALGRMRFLASLAVIAAGALMLRERTHVSRFFQSLHISGRSMAPAAPPREVTTLTPPVIVIASSSCRSEMALVTRDDLRVCVDKWEASLVEVDPGSGREAPYSPYLSVGGHRVKAVSKPNVVPQGYISRDEAEVACQNGGKRLCSTPEWKAACEGPEKTTYPYGDALDEQACNIHGRSGIGELFGDFGDSVWDFRLMNDPSLNALEGTVANTGTFTRCTNGFGVFDMVGNLHEWTADRNGIFRGGYYHDAEQNGSGCNYATSAHLPTYHDYSTGFRCCADAKNE